MVLLGDKTLQDLHQKVKYECQNVILKENVYIHIVFSFYHHQVPYHFLYTFPVVPGYLY